MALETHSNLHTLPREERVKALLGKKMAALLGLLGTGISLRALADELGLTLQTVSRGSRRRSAVLSLDASSIDWGKTDLAALEAKLLQIPEGGIRPIDALLTPPGEGRIRSAQRETLQSERNQFEQQDPIPRCARVVALAKRLGRKCVRIQGRSPQEHARQTGEHSVRQAPYYWYYFPNCPEQGKHKIIAVCDEPGNASFFIKGVSMANIDDFVHSPKSDLAGSTNIQRLVYPGNLADFEQACEDFLEERYAQAPHIEAGPSRGLLTVPACFSQINRWTQMPCGPSNDFKGRLLQALAIAEAACEEANQERDGRASVYERFERDRGYSGREGFLGYSMNGTDFMLVGETGPEGRHFTGWVCTNPHAEDPRETRHYLGHIQNLADPHDMSLIPSGLDHACATAEVAVFNGVGEQVLNIFEVIRQFHERGYSLQTAAQNPYIAPSKLLKWDGTQARISDFHPERGTHRNTLLHDYFASPKNILNFHRNSNLEVMIMTELMNLCTKTEHTPGQPSDIRLKDLWHFADCAITIFGAHKTKDEAYYRSAPGRRAWDGLKRPSIANMAITLGLNGMDILLKAHGYHYTRRGLIHEFNSIKGRRYPEPKRVQGRNR